MPVQRKSKFSGGAQLIAFVRLLLTEFWQQRDAEYFFMYTRIEWMTVQIVAVVRDE